MRRALGAVICLTVLLMAVLVAGLIPPVAAHPVRPHLGVPPGNELAECAAVGAGLGAAVGAAPGILAGLATGGIVLAVDGPAIVAGAAAGAGVGGGLGGLLCALMVNDQLPNTSALSLAWTQQQLWSLGTFINITAIGTHNQLSAYNQTEIYYSNIAANAALSQLGNTTFNPYLDLTQGGSDSVAAQLASFENAQTFDMNDAIQTFAWAYANAMGPNGAYAGHVTPLDFYQGTQGNQMDISGDNFWVGSEPSATGAQTYYAHGSGAVFTTANGPSCPGITQQWTNSTTGQSNATVNVGMTYAQFANGLKGCYGSASFPGSGGAYVPPTNDILDTYSLNIGPTYPALPNTFAVSTSKAFLEPTTMGIPGGYQYPLIGGPLFEGGAITNLPSYMWNIAHYSATVGQTYFQFLHSLGYWSAASVPYNCLIPFPNVAVEGLNTTQLASLTTPQLMGFYYAYLADIAKLYNTTLNATNFCGGHKVPPIGNSTGFNLGENITGSVYVPQPQTFPNENLNKSSTWAFYNESLVLMPTEQNLYIPVHKSWEPSALNPIMVLAYPSTTGGALAATLLPHVVGNSTNPNGTTGVSSSAYALNLTSCVVSGKTEATVCSIQFQTINNTKDNITNETGPPGPNTVTVDPLSAFLNWLSSLFGGGILGGIIADIILIIIIVVLVAILYLIVKRVISGKGS